MTERKPKANIRNFRKKFDNLVEKVKTPTSTEFMIAQAVEHAMDIREHRAAYRTPHGVGMVTFYKDNTRPFTIEGLERRSPDDSVGIAATLVTPDGRILAEYHTASFSELHSECKAYELSPNHEDVVVLREFKPEFDHDRWSHAYDFLNVIKLAKGNSGGLDIVSLMHDERDVAIDLFINNINMHDHGIVSPLITELISAALPEDYNFL